MPGKECVSAKKKKMFSVAELGILVEEKTLFELQTCIHLARERLCAEILNSLMLSTQLKDQ